MFVKALKGKIHGATVTGSKIDYPGSVAVDPVLMEAAGIKSIKPKVIVADKNNKIKDIL